MVKPWRSWDGIGLGKYVPRACALWALDGYMTRPHYGMRRGWDKQVHGVRIVGLKSKKKRKRKLKKLYDQCPDKLCWADSGRWFKKQTAPGRYRVKCKCGKFIGYFKEEGEQKNERTRMQTL
jgi:hypothetical protein